MEKKKTCEEKNYNENPPTSAKSQGGDQELRKANSTGRKKG